MGSRQPGPAPEAVRDVLEATADLLAERGATDADTTLMEVIHGRPATVLLRSRDALLYGAARQSIYDEIGVSLRDWCTKPGRTPDQAAAMLRRAAKRAGAAR